MASIINGLFAARAGIASNGVAIGVVGDNISNSNTIGYKAARTDFADLLSGGQQPGKVVGIGTQISGIVASQEQGSFEFTGRTLDLAVDGKGFFIVGAGAERFYTRAGNFKVNADGVITTNGDQELLGYPSSGSGALAPLNINTTPTQSGVATNTVTISGNLNAASSQVPAPPALNGVPTAAQYTAAGAAPPALPEPLTFSDLNNRAQFSTVVQIFDTLGASKNISLYFFKNSSNTWEAQAYANSEDVDATTPPRVGFPRYIGSSPAGGITFDSSGSKTAPAAGTPDITWPATLAWNNGSSATQPVTIALTPFTQFATQSNILSINQDGLGVGAVTGVSVENDGSVFATFDNGQASIIGTLALARFSNEEGLVRIGNNLLQRTLNSGTPVVGAAGSGTFGSIEGGSLELSTVDLATEFVRLISFQRGFQSNSRIISTINQLLGELVQII